MSQFIENQLDEFYAEFSEWFNMADFPDVEEPLLPSETPVFLNGERTPPDTDCSSVKGYDSFLGLCAVIRHRIGQRSLEQLKLAAELFNWTIEFGLFCCDTDSCAVIMVGSVEEVAPSLLERILNDLPDAGRKADERPVRFRLKDCDFVVEEVLDQWYGPDDVFFKVRANDGNLYILRHNQPYDEWRLEAFWQTSE